MIEKFIHKDDSTVAKHGPIYEVNLPHFDSRQTKKTFVHLFVPFSEGVKKYRKKANKRTPKTLPFPSRTEVRPIGSRRKYHSIKEHVYFVKPFGTDGRPPGLRPPGPEYDSCPKKGPTRFGVLNRSGLKFGFEPIWSF